MAVCDNMAVHNYMAIQLWHGLTVYGMAYVAMVNGDLPTWLFCYYLVWLYIAIRLHSLGMRESSCMWLYGFKRAQLHSCMAT